MRIISETPGAGRLGRHVQHDPRSRRYAYNTGGLKITPVRHNRNVPVFDQGDLGSCTGNAAVGSIATDPVFVTLPAGHPALDETLAVGIYSAATQLDDDADHYPPTDTGSTGLAAAKALQNAGYIAGYQHAFSFPDMLKALTQAPVMVGINWYSSFDRPDTKGYVKIKRGADLRGGHEIYADEIAKDAVGFQNSWSDQWGIQGRFYIKFADVERLLSEEGDVTIPIPALPVVNPVTGPSGPSGATGPAPSPDDVELLAAVQRWAKAKGLAA